MPACTIEFPVSIGDIVYAKISSLPKVENHIITFSATNEQEGQQSGSN